MPAHLMPSTLNPESQEYTPSPEPLSPAPTPSTQDPLPPQPPQPQSPNLAPLRARDARRCRLLFVFMGNFSSMPAAQGYVRHKKLFAELGTLLEGLPNLLQCSSFIFVPGPHDLAGSRGNMLPRSVLVCVCVYACLCLGGVWCDGLCWLVSVCVCVFEL